jgi:hypothetical protein
MPKLLKSADFGRQALCSSAILAMLAGCGASQPSNGTPGAIPPRAATVGHTPHDKSWMLPAAKSSALLYYSDGYANVYVLSYPQGKLVGTLEGFDGPQGVCSDSAGNVFVTVTNTENVIEYAHGGTQPIATLGDYGYYPLGCAVDPVTGNLAVANVVAFNGSAGTVAIYTGARGKPVDYSATGFYGYRWCAYDGSGNLFVEAMALSPRHESGNEGLTEMPYGQQSFTRISLNATGEGLQWDGRYLALVNPTSKVVYRIAVTGSAGTVVGTVNFTGLLTALGNDFEMQGHTIVMPYATQNSVNRIGLWNYPKGGILRRRLHKVDGLQAITLSY